MKTQGTALIVVALIVSAFSQVTFLDMPKRLQLYGRNKANDTAIVPIRGIVNSATGYTKFRLKPFRDNVARSAVDFTVSYNGNGLDTFSFQYPIKAELSEYKFQVYGVNAAASETLLKSADSVVAGDAYIVYGQSNAKAESDAPGQESVFIRSFGIMVPQGNRPRPLHADSQEVWRPACLCAPGTVDGNAGAWGLRLGRLIIDNQRIPVAVFNGGDGGTGIEGLQCNRNKREDTATYYGCLLRRLRLSGLTNSVRTMIYHQGENNTADANILTTYTAKFKLLHDDFFQDYVDMEKMYVFQIRNCNAPGQYTTDNKAQIREAQLRNYLTLSKMGIMSTSAATIADDLCHYGYANGYKIFGDNIYGIINRDLYNGSPDNVAAPRAIYAELTGTSEITLIMESVLDSITWYSGAQADFLLDGTTATISSGVVVGKRVKLTLSSAPTATTLITYIGHGPLKTPDPFVMTPKGVGSLSMYKMPITLPRYRDSLAVVAILAANNITATVASVTTRDGNGRVTALDLSNRGITTLPKDIGYLDMLTSLDLHDDSLSTLPREIRVLSPSVSLNVNTNFLCNVPADIETWVNSWSQNASWKSTQNCSGTRVITKSGASTWTNNFMVNIGNKNIIVRSMHPSDMQVLEIFGVSGKVVFKTIVFSNEISVDISNFRSGVYLLKVSNGEELFSRKFAKY